MFFSIKKGYGEQTRIENILQRQMELEQEQKMQREMEARQMLTRKEQDQREQGQITTKRSGESKSRQRKKERINQFK